MLVRILFSFNSYYDLFYLGISNLEECPLNRNIPVFVLVGGALALLKLLQVLWKQYNRHSAPSEEETADTQSGSVYIYIYTYEIKKHEEVSFFSLPNRKR